MKFDLPASIRSRYLADEPEIIRELLPLATPDPKQAAAISATAQSLVTAVRRNERTGSGLHAFLQHYDLSSEEGVVLMCLAESLLRIPDNGTADRLIASKLTSADWKRHLGASDSLFVNVSTWALMLTGRVMEIDEQTRMQPGHFLKRLVGRLEEPIVRTAMKTAMRIMAHQFVMGRDIREALQNAAEEPNRIYRYSFDMLGESALSAADADRYQGAYEDAIHAVGDAGTDSRTLLDAHSISVKLSALCPRYEYRHRIRAVLDLRDRLLTLCEIAAESGISLTVDAEEADRLDVSLEIFAAAYRNSALKGWPGLGLAVQAYQKRALPVLRWLNELARSVGRTIPVRLVKGAYWDTEIKRAQEQGLRDYPVFTRKSSTDVSYLACARVMLHECEALYPQFATHNAHSLSWIHHHARGRDFEFQRLHGMGTELYAEVVGAKKLNVPCRVYAPVGRHEDLLPYLIRRLLENGANTSFVNRLRRDEVSVADVIVDPVQMTVELGDELRHPRIPLPRDLYRPRVNSSGINLADPREEHSFLASVEKLERRKWNAAPLLDGAPQRGRIVHSMNPAHVARKVGDVQYASAAVARAALESANTVWPAWNARPAEERAAMLERAADMYEEHRAELVYLCVHETGRTVPDACSEIREAVDFLRYYAQECRRLAAEPQSLPGPTGEANSIRLGGRGVFLCISPWNFPIAIFTGQIAAALAAGNAVLAKPAEQACLCGFHAVNLMHRAGIPVQALQFLPGDGPLIGKTILSDSRLAGVAFTGSTETARAINRQLAEREGPLPVLIAETGGQNAMIADSSALPEQLVQDAIQSAFNSAGQRCSALRVLYVQDDIAERVIELLKGAMDELRIGDPSELETDVGPVIDRDARRLLQDHLRRMTEDDRVLHRCALPRSADGWFVAPALVQIKRIGELEREVFGPVLHVIPYPAEELDQVIADINATGYGLTLGIHSRIESTIEHIRSGVRAGNVYVNRNMIGAVVGVQPFGGMGLSGTGPKAGGPHYLPRFCTEQTLTVNTAAVGGNASLMAL